MVQNCTDALLNIKAFTCMILYHQKKLYDIYNSITTRTLTNQAVHFMASSPQGGSSRSYNVRDIFRSALSGRSPSSPDSRRRNGSGHRARSPAGTRTGVEVAHLAVMGRSLHRWNAAVLRFTIAVESYPRGAETTSFTADLWLSVTKRQYTDGCRLSLGEQSTVLFTVRSKTGDARSFVAVTYSRTASSLAESTTRSAAIGARRGQTQAQLWLRWGG